MSLKILPLIKSKDLSKPSTDPRNSMQARACIAFQLAKELGKAQAPGFWRSLDQASKDALIQEVLSNITLSDLEKLIISAEAEMKRMEKK